MTTQTIRVANLRKLIKENGGTNAFAAKLGYVNGSFLSQMAGDNPIREVTERTARKIEQACGLPDGWLDRADVAAAPPVETDSTLVTAAIQQTADAIEATGATMSPTKIGKLATLVYIDAAAHGGVRADYIKQLVQLAL